MTKLVIVDYANHCDRDGRPIGHYVKALTEYVNLLADKLDITIMAHKNYLDCINPANKATHRNLFLFVDPNGKNYIKKAKNIFVRLINLIDVFHQCRNEIVWFYGPDYLLYLYIALFGNKNNRIVCTMYQRRYTSKYALKDKMQNYFLSKTLGKIDLLVKTCSNIHFNHSNILFMPDYYYANKLYDYYKKNKKMEIVVCVGAMGNRKLLEELISVAKYVDINLMIIGTFDNKKRFNILNATKSENVIIKDQYLSYDEYYQILSNAKFSILPYNETMYDKKTSGVLIESMFLNTIPIAPKSLLEFNNIKGIGYSSLDDLKEINFNDIKIEEYKHSYEYQINSIYNKDCIVRAFVDAVEKLTRV